MPHGRERRRGCAHLSASRRQGGADHVEGGGRVRQIRRGSASALRPVARLQGHLRRLDAGPPPRRSRHSLGERNASFPCRPVPHQHRQLPDCPYRNVLRGRHFHQRRSSPEHRTAGKGVRAVLQRHVHRRPRHKPEPDQIPVGRRDLHLTHRTGGARDGGAVADGVARQHGETRSSSPGT